MKLSPFAKYALIFGLGAAGALILMGTFFVADEDLPPENTPTPTVNLTESPSPSPSPTATSTPTNTVPAGWQSYRNQEHNYAFSYPPNWEVSPNRPEGVVLTNFPYPQQNGTELQGDQVKVVLRVQGNPQGLSATEWRERNPDESTVLDREEITVDGVTALKLRVRTALGNVSRVIYISHQGKMYLVSWLGANDAMLEEIVNTFRFTN